MSSSIFDGICPQGGVKSNGRGATKRPRKATAEKPATDGRQAANDRPEIVITTEEHEVNEQAAKALAADPSVYQRGGVLVRVTRDASPAAKGIRRPFAPRIDALPAAILRERLAANARWVQVRETKKGPVEQAGHPPAWCVSAVHARGCWEGVRHLEAAVDYPVLRHDGTVLCKPGYDDKTGLLLECAVPPLALRDRPSLRDAQAALGELLEIVCDFPFASEVHKAAWVAALLTPLARFAFVGPAPLFLADANVRAAGKGLLLDCIAEVVTGERFTVAAYTSDEDELRKRLTSLALEGDRLVLLDNLEGRFGNAVLDAALTATSWKDRVLGANRTVSAPLFMTWYATGNNVVVHADTSRRICHIRLESDLEHPEERTGFTRANLLAWVRENRPRLLSAALTVLRAYIVAGRPDLSLKPWGSYEGWSGLVRSAVVWAGMEDPGETRIILQNSADVIAEHFAVIIECWEKMDPSRRGLTAAQVVETLRPKNAGAEAPAWHAEMRDALEGLVGKLDARALGNKLRSYRRRVFGGRFFDHADKKHQAIRWAVFPVSEFARRGEKTPHTPHTPPGGESGESGESSPPSAGSGSSWEEDHGDSWEGDQRGDGK